MLSKLNPFGIVVEHFKSLHEYGSTTPSRVEILAHILIPAVLSIAHFHFVREISEGVVSIIVSAASIVAGLMLNLLVLIYTLVANTRNSTKPLSNYTEFRLLATQTLATIAYSVLLCILLVVFAFFILSSHVGLANTGRLLTVYFGAATVLCLLIVLKRCFAIIKFDLSS
jgi:hypothetical protein